MKRKMDEFVRELLETIARYAGPAFNLPDSFLGDVCKDQEVDTNTIWWALRSALVFFRDNCQCFPFFREFGWQPEELTVDQVAICLLEMEILDQDGHKPEQERNTYAHFAGCGGCSTRLARTLSAWLDAVRGHDFGTAFRRFEQEREQVRLAWILKNTPLLFCRNEKQAGIIERFLDGVEGARKELALHYLEERFGDPSKPRLTDEELEQVLKDFKDLGDPNALN